MVHILLVILKLIGIVLATVFFLLLFLFFLLLVAPVCYRAAGSAGGKISIEGNISWLFFVLHCNIKYDSEKGMVWFFRILGLLFASNDESFVEKQEAKKAGKEPKRIEQDSTAGQVEAEQKDGVKQHQKEASGTETEEDIFSDKEEPPTAKRENRKKQSKKQSKKPSKKSGKKPGKKQFLDALLKKKEKLYQGKEYFLGEQNKEVMSYLFFGLKKIMLHILPDKFQGKVEFGLEDPYFMGQILAVLGILMPIYEDKLLIIPDFEETYLKGEFSLKGTIIPGYLVFWLIRMIFNKEVRRVIKEGRKLLGGNA